MHRPAVRLLQRLCDDRLEKFAGHHRDGTRITAELPAFIKKIYIYVNKVHPEVPFEVFFEELIEVFERYGMDVEPPERFVPVTR